MASVGPGHSAWLFRDIYLFSKPPKSLWLSIWEAQKFISILLDKYFLEGKPLFLFRKSKECDQKAIGVTS
jgi:hypothetical protein